MIARRALALLALLVAAPGARAQTSPPTLAAIRDAEDARAATPAQLATLRAGLAAGASGTRRVAVRALGRLQRPSLIGEIAAALRDPSPAVRAEAAIALLHASAGGGAAQARAALLARLLREPDPAAAAAIAEAAGWVAHTDTAQVRETADALVARSRRAAGDAPRVVTFGIARGLYALGRQQVARSALPPSAVSRLERLAGWRRASAQRMDVDVRELALLALAGSRQATVATFERALGDPQMAVRVAAARTLPTLGDSVASERLLDRAMRDRSALVRTAAVFSFGQRFASAPRCARLTEAAGDSALSPRLLALDALAVACTRDAAAIALLDRVAASLRAPRGGDAGAWHAPAHAIVALARLAPDRARARLAPFVASPSFFVRAYAAQAAGQLGDAALLRRLAFDAHPNVRTAAVDALSHSVGHAADSVYVAALDADDSQLLQAASAALAASFDPRAVPSLLRALDRVSAARSETSRDARVALVARVRELGDTVSAARLRPYLADFDTLVAARAADAIGALTGTRPTPAPVPLARQPLPSESELAALARARVVLDMDGPEGGRVVFRLFPYETPTNSARVAKLAREGRLDGLTFHRVVLGRFAQGGSPMANEYAGWGAYSRDEFAVGHHRGVVSMSTRGYDTADGQIVLHATDSFHYDHAYTVIGEIVAGQEVVDRMQEGARIRRASVMP